MARGRFGGGEGLVDNPYLIEDAFDLHAIRLFPDKHFKLAYDINLGHTPFTDNQGWRPIENFSGVLDGNGKTINNLYINTGEDYAGLFKDYKHPAVVKNVTFKGVNITGNNYVGTVFGRIQSAYPSVTTFTHYALENISISGRIRVSGNYGGIFAGEITYNNGLNVHTSVSGTNHIWTAYKNLFTDANLIKLTTTANYVAGIFGACTSNTVSNTDYGNRYHYRSVKGFNVVNCGNSSVSGDNNARLHPICILIGSPASTFSSAYFNTDSWRKNVTVSINDIGETVLTDTTYNGGVVELNSEQIKDSSNFSAELLNEVSKDGFKMWQFEAAKDVYPKLYFSAAADMAFIKFNNGLYVYESGEWVKKFDDIPDMEDAENVAMSSLKDIPAEAWEKLKTLTKEPVLINIAKKQSTYYTGQKKVKASEMTNFNTENKKIYRRSVNFFEFADGIFNIQTTK